MRRVLLFPLLAPLAIVWLLVLAVAIVTDEAALLLERGYYRLGGWRLGR